MKNTLIVISSIMTGIGLTFIIIDLNILAMGYNLLEYLIFILTKGECILFFVGIIMLVGLLKRRNIKC